MTTDDPERAKAMRAGAQRVRKAADTLLSRADQLTGSTMGRLLELQAGILNEGAAVLDDRALAVEPAKGRA